MKIALIGLVLAIALGGMSLLVSTTTASHTHGIGVAGDIGPGDNPN